MNRTALLTGPWQTQQSAFTPSLSRPIREGARRAGKGWRVVHSTEPAVNTCNKNRPARRGFLLIECLVYMAALAVVLGVGYAAVYHCMNAAAGLRRNADDIARALNAGEIWRADVRAAKGDIRENSTAAAEALLIPNAKGGITYRFADDTVFRRAGNGPWTPLLQRVKSSTMQKDHRKDVTAWRWEIELQAKNQRLHTKPLFTFIAVPAASISP